MLCILEDYEACTSATTINLLEQLLAFRKVFIYTVSQKLFNVESGSWRFSKRNKTFEQQRTTVLLQLLDLSTCFVDFAKLNMNITV